MQKFVCCLTLAVSVVSNLVVSSHACALTPDVLQKITEVKIKAQESVLPGKTEKDRVNAVIALMNVLDLLSPQEQLSLVQNMEQGLTYHEKHLLEEAGNDDAGLGILAIAATTAILVTAPKIAALKAKSPHISTFSVGVVLALATIYLKDHSNETKDIIAANVVSYRKALRQIHASLSERLQTEALDAPLTVAAPKPAVLTPVEPVSPNHSVARERNASHERDSYANRHRGSDTTLD